VNFIGASILIPLIVLVLFAPQRWVLLGLMGGVLFLTQQQSIDVFGVNLTAIRGLECVCFTRLMVRREFLLFSFNGIDKSFLSVYAYTTLIFLMRSDVGQVEMVGSWVDAMLCYFSFRTLIRDIEGFKWFLRAFVIILVPYVALLAIEMLTTKNPFVLMGALPWDELRGGRIRAMGSFRNPSLQGTLGASLLPIYIGLAFTRRGRISYLAGIGLCLMIVILSNSGGPLSAAAIGVAGWLCWAARRNMIIVRRTLVGIFVLLLVFMKAPVWYILDRVSLVSGGSGWHRAHLMEMAFRDLDHWWLAGMSLNLTKDWFPYILGITGAADITNTFIAVGIQAGLLAMALLIFLLVRAYRALGQAISAVRTTSAPNEDEYLLWGLGCMLLTHIFSWFGITYFDQIYVIWFMHLAAISSISQVCITTNNNTNSSVKKQLITNRITSYQRYSHRRLIPVNKNKYGAKENLSEDPVRG
jgi:hypothetical protein